MAVHTNLPQDLYGDSKLFACAVCMYATVSEAASAARTGGDRTRNIEGGGMGWREGEGDRERARTTQRQTDGDRDRGRCT